MFGRAFLVFFLPSWFLSPASNNPNNVSDVNNDGNLNNDNANNDDGLALRPAFWR